MAVVPRDIIRRGTPASLLALHRVMPFIMRGGLAPAVITALEIVAWPRPPALAMPFSTVAEAAPAGITVLVTVVWQTEGTYGKKI